MKPCLCLLLSATLLGCLDTEPSTSRVHPSAETPEGATGTDATETDSTRAVPGSQEPDNTGVNVRDRDSDAKTPVDQFENAGDIDITAKIRSRIVATEMAMAAHNIKIITQYGRVTLRGPVRTEQEKQMIEEMAKKVAGSENVDSRLEVAGK